MSLLDDFKRFVTDAQSGSQFATWAATNHAELLRWQSFRDAILAGKRPAFPVMTTGHGRELIDAGRLYLDATATADLPPPPPPPPPPPTSGSYKPNKTFDGGQGTSVDAFLAALAPGDVAGLAGTCLINSPISHAGLVDKRIVLTSTDFSAPATLRGRVDMRGAAAWWTFDYFYAEDAQTAQPTSWVIGGNNCLFRRLACTNHNSHIGWDFLDDATYGRSHDNTIEQCRIYNIGPAAFDNRSHGIYNQGVNNTIQDNVIYGCSSRAVQLRGARGSTVQYNTASDNGCGIIFGDLGAVGNKVTKNIWAHRTASGRYLVEAYDPLGVNSGNTFDDNFVFDGGIQPSLAGVTVTATHTGDPLFTDRTGRVFTLQSGSPAAGYGPRVFCPL